MAPLKMSGPESIAGPLKGFRKWFPATVATSQIFSELLDLVCLSYHRDCPDSVSGHEQTSDRDSPAGACRASILTIGGDPTVSYGAVTE